MTEPKIHLSAAEMNLVCDAQLILTKNTIIKKTINLFADLQHVMQLENVNAESSYLKVSPKISKGENYLGLPYVVLDYPRHTSSDGILFVRTMFWWGHYFSSTLQLSGSLKEKYTPIVIATYKRLAFDNFYICVSKDPWQHHFETDNYLLIKTISESKLSDTIEKAEHLKIAARWPLQQWDNVPERLLSSWKFFQELISQAVE